MESLTHSLNHQLPQELHFDKYTQHILENSRIPNLADTTTTIALSSPIITNYDSAAAASASHQTTTSEFLQKLGATFIHSIQLQSLPRANNLDSSSLLSSSSLSSSSSSSISSVNDIDMDFSPHHLVMDSHNYNNAMDELQKQLDYDKFMNEVWIGVVLTLILISMIFCFCSCFLYHQFRVWKRNYHTTVVQTNDVEAVKLNTDLDDPVPEYTLVSGLPSYEAALELLHKNPQSCLIVHPSVLEVFNKNEKTPHENSPITETSAALEVSMPLLNDSSSHNNNNNNNNNKNPLPSYNEATSHVIPTAATLPYNHSLASLLSLASQITIQCKPKSTPNANELEKQFKA